MELMIIILCAVITAQMNNRLREKSYERMEHNVTENIKGWFTRSRKSGNYRRNQ